MRVRTLRSVDAVIDQVVNGYEDDWYEVVVEEGRSLALVTMGTMESDPLVEVWADGAGAPFLTLDSLGPGDQQPPITHHAARAGYVIAEGPDRDSAVRRARKAIAAIAIETDGGEEAAHA